MAKSKSLKVIEPAQPEIYHEQPVNPYLAFGNAVASMSRIKGQLLKFNKGEWTAGTEAEELSEGTRLVANMEQLLIGWQRWEDNRPVEEDMGLVLDEFIAKKRHELSFTDQAEWETDKNSGLPRDPWRWTCMLILKGTDRHGQIYTFSTQSKGGIDACGLLARTYGKEMREHPDEFPIVALGRESYKHAEYGKIYKPLFPIVDWRDKGDWREEENVDAPVVSHARKKIR